MARTLKPEVGDLTRHPPICESALQLFLQLLGQLGHRLGRLLNRFLEQVTSKAPLSF